MGSHDQRNDHSTNLSVTGSFLARDAGKIYPRHHEYLCGLLSGCILSFSAQIVVIISRVIGTNVHTVALSMPFVFVNCASISALFQIQYLEFYSTYQSALSL